jgi:aminoglycoside N3'-acetyltransferase
MHALGVEPGDHVAIGLSFKALGPVEGGPEAFIDALLEAVGPQGTLMVNTFTEHFGLSRVKTGRVDYVFDYRSTPCNTGLVPELVRQREGALRSKHPVCSVAAIGSQARYLTDGHDMGARAYSPFSRLAELNGKYLSIGIGKRLAGFRHEAQDLAGLLRVVPKKLAVPYRQDNGEIEFFINREPPGCVRTLGVLEDHLDALGLVSRGQVGQATSVLVPARESLEQMTELLRLQPQVNLCDRVSCLWCRETERRMDLYGRLEHRQYFQKYRPIIALLALANWWRMGDNPILTQARRVIKRIP